MLGICLAQVNYWMTNVYTTSDGFHQLTTHQTSCYIIQVQVQVQVQNVLYCIYYKGTQSNNKHVQGKRQDKANRMYQNELHTNTWAANNTLEGVHELIHLQMIYRYIYISVHTQDAAMHAYMRTYAHACMYTHMNVWCMQAHSQDWTYKETLILQIYMLDKIYTCNIYG